MDPRDKNTQNEFDSILCNLDLDGEDHGPNSILKYLPRPSPQQQAFEPFEALAPPATDIEVEEYSDLDDGHQDSPDPSMPMRGSDEKFINSPQVKEIKIDEIPPQTSENARPEGEGGNRANGDGGGAASGVAPGAAQVLSENQVQDESTLLSANRGGTEPSILDDSYFEKKAGGRPSGTRRFGPKTTSAAMARKHLFKWLVVVNTIIAILDLVKLKNLSHLTGKTKLLSSLGLMVTVLSIGTTYQTVKVDNSNMYLALCLIQVRITLVIFLRAMMEKGAFVCGFSLEEVEFGDHRQMFPLFSFLSTEIMPLAALFNVILALQVIEGHQSKVVFWSSSIFMLLMKSLYKASWLQIDRFHLYFWALVVLIAFLYASNLFIKITLRIQEEHFKFELAYQVENSDFKRIIDSVKEAMLIIRRDSLKFSNRRCNALFFDGNAPSPGTFDIFFTKPIFYAANDTKLEEYSIAELLCDPSLLCKPGSQSKQVFTLYESVARCREFSQLQRVLAQLQAKEKAGFYFLTIELIELDRGEDRKVTAIQIQDVSEKVRSAGLDSERVFLSYVNGAVSHEMRNPLNSILSVVETLKSEGAAAMTETFKTHLGILESATRMMDFNIENILSLAQAKEGKLFKNVKPHRLRGEAHEAIQILAPKANLLGIEVATLFWGLDAESVGFIDSRRFQQVIFNLVSNALKFMDKQDGKVLVHVARVISSEQLESFGRSSYWHLRSQADKILPFKFFDQDPGQAEFAEFEENAEPESSSKVVVSVLDNGAGITAEKQANLFTLFQGIGGEEGTKAESLNTEGLGIGLILNKMLLELFGGSISVYSRSGVGSLFQVVFPIEEPTQVGSKTLAEISPRMLIDDGSSTSSYTYGAELSIRAQRLRFENRIAMKCEHALRLLQEPTYSFSTKRILVVDDEPYNCLAVFALLKGLKLEGVESRVDMANSGRQALDLVKANIQKKKQRKRLPDPRGDCQYSLILTDCSMPFMNGYELTESILTELDKAGVEEKPLIVAITGHAELEYIQKAFESGIKQVYAKPVTREQLGCLLLSQGFEFEIPEKIRTQFE